MDILKHYELISKVLILFSGLTAAALSGSLLYPGRGAVYLKGTEFAGMIRKKGRTLTYERLSAWLRKNGASYHIGKKTDPGRFIGMCVVLGCMGFLAGMSVSVFMGFVLGSLTALFLPFSVPALNRADSKAMLPDIRLIYHSLGVQIKSGVYVTDALAECSTSVTNRRLKDALSEFYAEVIMKSDIYSSLERFRSAFDDRYIDSLCITVVQALESGQAVELLGDIAEQVRDMEEEVFESRKASLDRLLTLCQLLVLGAVLSTALYTCVMYMMSRAVGFR